MLEGLLQLDGKEFEGFIGHLLGILGFSATVTPYSNDKGIDVVGKLNAEGLAEIELKVQAKRFLSSSIGSGIVKEMRGSLKSDEHGCIITTLSFKKEAVEEAKRDGYKPIKLIDGHELTKIILKNFDEIDDTYKTRFSITKRRDFNVEDMFEPDTEDYYPENTDEGSQTKRKSASFDTIVCSAYEEGFKSAFLGEKAWWQIPIGKENLPHIKFIAIYQTAPVSKITYYGKIKSIEEYKNSGNYILYLDGEPVKLDNPVPVGVNKYLRPQGPKYAILDRILHAKSLDDVFI